MKGEFTEGKLADSLPCHAEPSNDYYFDLLEPRKIDLSGGLFLFHSKLGWILGGRIEQPLDKNNESSLLVSTVGSVPDGIKPTIHMLTSIDHSLSTKPSLELFWNLEVRSFQNLLHLLMGGTWLLGLGERTIQTCHKTISWQLED